MYAYFCGYASIVAIAITVVGTNRRPIHHCCPHCRRCLVLRGCRISCRRRVCRHRRVNRRRCHVHRCRAAAATLIAAAAVFIASAALVATIAVFAAVAAFTAIVVIMTQPTEEHFQCAQRVLRYVSGTKDRGLLY